MSQKNVMEPLKSSAEILSELFSSFNALPPILKNKVLKKHKKSKKKHKHKDKKHKKKSKHKYSSDGTDDSCSEKSYKHNKKRIKKEQLSEETNLKSLELNLEKDQEQESSCKCDNNIFIKSEPVDKGYEKLLAKDDVSLNQNSVDSPEKVVAQSESVHEEKCDTEQSVEDKEVSEKSSGKITIKNLKNSIAYEAAIKEIEDKAREKEAKFEDGEVTSESEDDIDDSSSLNIQVIKSLEITKNDKKRKRSHKDSKHKHVDYKRHKKEKHKKRSKSRSKERDKHYNRRDKSEYYTSTRFYKETSSYDRDKHRERYRDEKRSRDSRRSRSRDNKRSRSRSRDDRRSRSRDERRSRSKDRSQSKFYKDRKRRSKSPSSSIDKKKLLEIARKNAINMLKSGTLPEALTLGPQAQEKVIAAIKAGGKTIEELTDFCKNLSKKEELGELSSVSSNEEDLDSNSEGEKVFHHPFQLKEKPTSIVMNIKNATPLPLKTSKEKSAELRMQFPVSSGQLHRKTENEWVPVSPKKPEPIASLPVVPPPAPEPVPQPVPKPVPQPVPQSIITTPVPPMPSILPPKQTEIDIGSIVSQRLNAMRKLQENPNDMQALNEIYKVQQEMQTWATSKQQIGQFTGSTGAQILTPAELSSGYQAWARKDQLQNAAPVTGGMGMHLLQKMGWKPGEGLGKEKTGSLEPLLLEVKLDKKGLVADEEMKTKKPVKVQKNPNTTKTLTGKHPVSLLGEFATKRKLGVPQYECCFECGPDHKKNFLFKVVLNGTEYKPNVASSTKKQAKADAATVCLQQLGLLPS